LHQTMRRLNPGVARDIERISIALKTESASVSEEVISHQVDYLTQGTDTDAERRIIKLFGAESPSVNPDTFKDIATGETTKEQIYLDLKQLNLITYKHTLMADFDPSKPLLLPKITDEKVVQAVKDKLRELSPLNGPHKQLILKQLMVKSPNAFFKMAAQAPIKFTKFIGDQLNSEDAIDKLIELSLKHGKTKVVTDTIKAFLSRDKTLEDYSVSESEDFEKAAATYLNHVKGKYHQHQVVEDWVNDMGGDTSKWRVSDRGGLDKLFETHPNFMLNPAFKNMWVQMINNYDNLPIYSRKGGMTDPLNDQNNYMQFTVKRVLDWSTDKSFEQQWTQNLPPEEPKVSHAPSDDQLTSELRRLEGEEGLSVASPSTAEGSLSSAEEESIDIELIEGLNAMEGSSESVSDDVELLDGMDALEEGSEVVSDPIEGQLRGLLGADSAVDLESEARATDLVEELGHLVGYEDTEYVNRRIQAYAFLGEFLTGAKGNDKNAHLQRQEVFIKQMVTLYPKDLIRLLHYTADKAPEGQREKKLANLYLLVNERVRNRRSPIEAPMDPYALMVELIGQLDMKVNRGIDADGNKTLVSLADRLDQEGKTVTEEDKRVLELTEEDATIGLANLVILPNPEESQSKKFSTQLSELLRQSNDEDNTQKVDIQQLEKLNPFQPGAGAELLKGREWIYIEMLLKLEPLMGTKSFQALLEKQGYLKTLSKTIIEGRWLKNSHPSNAGYNKRLVTDLGRLEGRRLAGTKELPDRVLVDAEMEKALQDMMKKEILSTFMKSAPPSDRLEKVTDALDLGHADRDKFINATDIAFEPEVEDHTQLADLRRIKHETTGILPDEPDEYAKKLGNLNKMFEEFRAAQSVKEFGASGAYGGYTL
ncbi:hypothetical protein HOH87_04605, partial [bacterium]|nr:hypothetical protein [bacterium]